LGRSNQTAFIFEYKPIQSADGATTINQGIHSKMATPAKQSITRKEAIDAYARLKAKAKRANEVAKRESESMMRNLVTVGSAAAMGAYLGDVKKKNSSTEIQGIDIDLIVGGGALAAGMMKWGGKFSDTLSAIGTGVLAQYAGRSAQERFAK